MASLQVSHALAASVAGQSLRCVRWGSTAVGSRTSVLTVEALKTQKLPQHAASWRRDKAFWRSRHSRQACAALDQAAIPDVKGSPEAPSPALSPALRALYAESRTWLWRGHEISYVAVGAEGPPVVLVHGFGASLGHWRRNIPVLAGDHRVFALDLLGLGASAKPLGFQYTMETWGELLLDFLREVVEEPAVLVGNSIGSLAVLIASAEASGTLVRGTVLLNCAGGMNNKAIVDDWRIALALPLFWLIDWLLLQPSIARWLFDSLARPDTVRNVLQAVYVNKDAVDDELVEVILRPAFDEGALNTFISVITGPPGPRPEALVPKISHPILLLWGSDDTFTPMDGPIGRYFAALPTTHPTKVDFHVIEKTGHCPHDDTPELVHKTLMPWLRNVLG